MAHSNPKTFLRSEKSEYGFFILILQLIAFWSVWRWFYLRLSTSSEESYGILAILAIIGLSYFGKNQFLKQKNLVYSIVLIFLFSITYTFTPPLLRAVIAVTVLTFFISGWRFGKIFHIGIWSLFLLSLPIVASLQFYLGFPLRVVMGEATAFLLKLNGFGVIREGVCLHFGEKLIWIDAPCSGVKMLWAGFFLTAILITILKFNWVKSLLAFAISFVIILVGNIFRATALFFLEAEIIKMPEFAHSGVGVICFLFTCIAILISLQKLQTKNEKIESLQLNNNDSRFLFLILPACILAFIAPFWATPSTKTFSAKGTEFPQSFANKQLKELPLSEREKYFLDDFPGEIKRYTDGEREFVIRYVTGATRKLHPSSDCFSAIGYQIKPLSLKVDESGNRWSCFSAKRDDEKLKVCERIFSRSGESWTDVSSWYWSALSNENIGGYWAITMAENGLE